MEKFYKILNYEECHHEMQYKDGLNTDVMPFNPQGDCFPGGIYFAKEDIFAFLNYGCWIREVSLPEGEPVYVNPGYPEKFKAHRVILGERRVINFETIKHLVEQGANIHATDDFALRHFIKKGHLDTVKYLVSQGADIHILDDTPLRSASSNGYLNIVKFLVESGADVHAVDDEALRTASEYGYVGMVKFLVENGANVHANGDAALKWAFIFGHLNIVRYLVSQGANISICDDWAIKRALDGQHYNVVEYLKSLKITTTTKITAKTRG